MTKNKTIIILGVLVALLSFLGFPGPWETFFFIIFGLLIALLSLLVIAKERIEGFSATDKDVTDTI